MGRRTRRCPKRHRIDFALLCGAYPTARDTGQQRPMAALIHGLRTAKAIVMARLASPRPTLYRTAADEEINGEGMTVPLKPFAGKDGRARDAKDACLLPMHTASNVT